MEIIITKAEDRKYFKVLLNSARQFVDISEGRIHLTNCPKLYRADADLKSLEVFWGLDLKEYQLLDCELEILE